MLFISKRFAFIFGLLFIFISSVFSFEMEDYYLDINSNEYTVLSKLFLKEGKEFIEKLKPKRILFLGDKENSEKNFISLADYYGGIFQDSFIEFYKTDFLCKNRGKIEGTNIFEYQVDHRQKFPFYDNSFDMIIGLQVLCHCMKDNPWETCGGLGSFCEDCHKDFFKEVARVLNKKNKNALGIIQGVSNSLDKNQKRKSCEVYKNVLYTLNEEEVFPDLSYMRTIYYGPYQKEFNRFGIIMGNFNLQELE